SLVEPLNVRGHFFLFGRQLLGLAEGALDVALAAAGLRAREAVERVLQPLFRGGGLCAAVARSIRRRPAHRIGGFAQLPRGVVQFRPRLVARELLQTSRGLLGLVGERALLAAAAALRLSGSRRTPLP